MKSNIYSNLNVKKDKFNLEHVKNIKYKNFHPIEKKKTIKKINEYIDKFNAVNFQLFDTACIEMSNLADDRKIKKILAQNGISNRAFAYSIKYFHNLNYNTTKFLNSLSNKRRKKMKKFLDETIINPTKKLSITQISEQIQELEKNLDDFKREEEKNQLQLIKKEAAEEISSLVSQVKIFMKTDQKKKLKRSIEFVKQITTATKDLKSTDFKNQPKEYKYFKEVLDVMEGKEAKLTDECVEFLDNTMATNRPWVPTSKIKSDELDLRVLEKVTDSKTKNVIINFFSTVTDLSGIEYLNKYIKKKQLEQTEK